MPLNWKQFTNNYNKEIKRMNENKAIFEGPSTPPRFINLPARPPPTRLPPLPPVNTKRQSPVVTSPNRTQSPVFVPSSINSKKIKALYNQLIGKNSFTKENINKLSNKNKLNLEKYILNKNDKTNKNYKLQQALAGVERSNQKQKIFSNFFSKTKYGETARIQFKNFEKGKRIGKESAFGQVFALTNRNGVMDKYVLKRTLFSKTDKSARLSFETEIKVGSMPGIEEVGPRVYIYRIVEKQNG